METLLLSDLLKIGVRYIGFDSTNVVIFNDGTKMWSKITYWNNGEGSDGEDWDFTCVRDGISYNVLDDVNKTLTTEDRMAMWTSPKSAGKLSRWSVE